MAISSTFKKRLRSAITYPLPDVIDQVSLSGIKINDIKIGSVRTVCVIRNTTPYASGFLLPKTALFSGNTLVESVELFKCTQDDFPRAGYNIFTDTGVLRENWFRYSLNGTVAIPDPTIKSWRVDPSAPTRLRVTGTDGHEITSASDILNSTQLLVFIYNCVTNEIVWN